LTPPRPGSASAGRSTGTACGSVSWKIVAWYVRSGTAGTTCCDTESASRTPGVAAGGSRSAAATCQSSFATATGTVTSHATSRAAPGASDACRASSAGSGTPAAATFAVTATSSGRGDALRTVNVAR